MMRKIRYPPSCNLTIIITSIITGNGCVSHICSVLATVDGDARGSLKKCQTDALTYIWVALLGPTSLVLPRTRLPRSKAMHSNGTSTAVVVIVIITLSLSLVHGLVPSSPTRHQFQKTTLLSWDGGVALGHTVEERDSEVRGASSTVAVRLDSKGAEGGSSSCGSGDGDGCDGSLILKLPGNDAGGGGGLASELWPAALASSILLRSPEFRSFAAGKNIVELGSGCGLAGLVAAEMSATCLLTDNDEAAAELLRTKTCPINQDAVQAKLSALQLDWRDGVPDRGEEGPSIDLVLGSDIAYYYHLLRPMMDTSRAFLGDRKGATLMVIGQANRECQWELYKNIKNGCYNQLTDEHEPPWPGTTQMLLYKLKMSAFCPSLRECENRIEGTLPMSVILHHHGQILPFYPFRDLAHVGTEQDDESILKSF
jgi:Lysine methyltransferase